MVVTGVGKYDDSVVAFAPPPYADEANYFGSLEETATECSIDEVSSNLQKAKTVWMRAYS